MKTHFSPLKLLGVILSAAAISANSEPQNGQPIEMRDAATHDQLSRALRMQQQKDPIREMGPEIGKSEEDPSKALASRDLIKSSAILTFNGALTLVPKRAVLHIPEKLADRMGPQPGVKVKTFREFYQSNRGWIRTIEVTREQALGHVPFDESTIEAISESSSVVIATYKQGPISVLPLKEPEDVPTPLEMKPVLYRR